MANPNPYLELVTDNDGQGAASDNPYTPLLQADTAQKVRSSVSSVIDINPDVDAKLQQLAKRYGVPLDAVRLDPKSLERKQELESIDYAELARKAPGTANFMADPQAAAIARDDVENMSMIESLWKEAKQFGTTVSNAVARGWQSQQRKWTTNAFNVNARTVQDVDRIEQMLADGADPNTFNVENDPLGLAQMTREERAKLRADALELAKQGAQEISIKTTNMAAIPRPAVTEKVMNADKVVDPVATFYSGETVYAENLKGWEAFKATAAEFVKSPASFIADVGLESLVGNLDAMALAIPASMVGGPALGAATMGIGSYNTAYATAFLDNLESQGVDIRDPAELAEAVKNPEMMDQARKTAHVYASILSSFDAASMGVASKVALPKSLQIALKDKAFTKELTNMLIVQPQLQGTLGVVGEVAASSAVGKEVGTGELFGEFFGEMLGTPIEVLTASGRRIYGDFVKVDAAEESARRLQKLNDLATASKIRSRDVDTFESFVASVTADGPIKEVFVDAQTLAQSGIAAQLAEVSPSVAEQFEYALTAGTQISIPVAEYTARIAGTELNQSLLPHLRTEANGFSQVEAQEYMQSFAQELKADVERTLAIRKSDEEFKAQVESVKTNIKTQLDSAGRFTPQVNDAYAAMIGNFYVVTASKLGISPDELLQRYPLRVQAQSPVGGQQYGQAPANPLPADKLAESGEFKTGKSVTFNFVHNTESATKLFGKPKKGDRFKRDIEPSGRYVTAVGDLANTTDDKRMEKGSITFFNPLVIKGDDWKQVLFDHYKKRGKQLSKALIADGYDGVVTIDNYGPSEILDLTSFDEAKALYQSEKSGVGEGTRTDIAKLKSADDTASRTAYPKNIVDQTDSNILNQGEAVATLTGKEISDAKDLKTLREAVKAWYEKHLRGKSVVNKDSGKTIEFRSSKKAFNSSANPEKLKLFAALEDAVANGKIVRSNPPIDPTKEANIKAYHFLIAPVVLNGERIDLGVTIRETRDGHWFYNLNAIQEGPHQLNRSAPAHKAGGGTEGGALNQSLPEDNLNVQVLKQGENTNRGSFNPATNTITLLKNADLSTFLHESGHFFLETQLDIAARIAQESAMFGNTSNKPGEQQILEDTNAILKWFGIRDLNEWASLDFEEKRSYHEKFARGFEAYLFEGKAPSIEVQGIFQRFRAWMINVYKELKNLNVELNDEVRQVFDRMLATDEQIELAKQGRSMMELFATAQQAGMTVEEFAAYQALGVDATNDAIQDLQARGLRDLAWSRNARGREIKRLQKLAAARRAEVTIDVRREVMSQPIYRAWQFLTGKLSAADKIDPPALPKSDPNVVDETIDSLFTAIAKLGGLDRAEVESQWGFDPKERSPMPAFGKYTLRREGGLSIDAMAEMLAERGYLELDENGRFDQRELEEKFDAELRGDIQYSTAVDERIMRGEGVAGEGLNLEALGAGRFDALELSSMGLPDNIIEIITNLKMTAKNGLHPDLVAELFGFTSGDELIRTLAIAQEPKQEINDLVDARMLELYGELATPEAIEREADKAIHNENRARLVATEANALAKATGQRKVLVPAAKAYAREMINRLKIRDIRPGQYAATEVRNAKAAEKASRAGDLATAAAEKRNQLINTFATRAAYDAQEKVEAGVRYLKKFDSEGTRKNLDADYLDQIDALLERFDLRKMTNKAMDKRKSLVAWITAQEDEGLSPDIPEDLQNEALRKPYKELTVEEFSGLIDTVKQIEHMGRLKNKLLTAADNRAFAAVRNEVAESIRVNSDDRVVDNEGRATFNSKLSMFGRWYAAAHRKAASVVRELDGFMDGGVLWNYFIRPMNLAGDFEADLRADATRRLHEISKPILTGEKMGGKGRFFPSLSRAFNRGERLAIALNWGNDSNRQRLMGGKGWTQAQLQPVLESLTAAELKFVQDVWDFFESYWPQVAALEKETTGKEPVRVEPTPFTIQSADGQTVQMRGGYYPIKYNTMESGKANQFAKAEEAKDMMRAAFTSSTTRRSFTKTRAEEVVGRPIKLSFDGIWQGANEMIHDLAWRKWTIDANRLLRGLDGPIRTHYGAEFVDVLQKTIEANARGDVSATNMVESSLNHIRTGSTVVGLGWNLTTALLQPLGLTQSVVRVGAKWMARGLTQFYGTPSHMLDITREVRAKSSMMENRALTMNREINDVRNRLESKGDWQQRAEATYFWLIQKVQASVDYPTWLGAYEKAMSNPNMTEEKAIAMADQAVIDSQGGGQIKDLSLVQRGHPAFKLFTNFYSYFNVLMNMVFEQTKKRVKAKEYVGLMGDYVLLMILPAVLSGVIRNAVKGEDDEEEYVKSVVGEIVAYPFGMFVGLREIGGAAQTIAGVGGPFNYSGPAGLRLFSEVEKLAKQINQGDLDMALFKAANSTGGILFHYPAGQVNRAVDGVAALISGETKNPLAPLTGYAR